MVNLYQKLNYFAKSRIMVGLFRQFISFCYFNSLRTIHGEGESEREREKERNVEREGLKHDQ